MKTTVNYIHCIYLFLKYIRDEIAFNSYNRLRDKCLCRVQEWICQNYLTKVCLVCVAM